MMQSNVKMPLFIVHSIPILKLVTTDKSTCAHQQHFFYNSSQDSAFMGGPSFYYISNEQHCLLSQNFPNISRWHGSTRMLKQRRFQLNQAKHGAKVEHSRLQTVPASPNWFTFNYSSCSDYGRLRGNVKTTHLQKKRSSAGAAGSHCQSNLKALNFYQAQNGKLSSYSVNGSAPFVQHCNVLFVVQQTFSYGEISQQCNTAWHTSNTGGTRKLFVAQVQ